jgi:hypothetical protein
MYEGRETPGAQPGEQQVLGAKTRPASRWVWVCGAAWVFAVLGGTGLLWRYKSTPGAVASVAPVWPSGTEIVTREPDRATIVMLAHPFCPCTAASLGELARLMAEVGDKATAHVLFLRPEDVPSDWEDSDLWQQASRIRGVHVAWDPDGREARRFGAQTSGQTVVYDAAGAQIFRGGITSARGHAGDNIGSDSIASLLLRGRADQRTSSVFGCSLDEARP